MAPAEWDVIPGRDRLSHSSSALSSLSQGPEECFWPLVKSHCCLCQLGLMPYFYFFPCSYSVWHMCVSSPL